MAKREIFDISCELLRETDRAILVTIDSGENKVWLPKSMFEYEKEQDGSYTVTGPTWMLQEKGLL